MNKKMILVIALIGIGLYALPQTMALFAGQHSFVNIDATGNQIDCVKCHGDVKAELSVGLTGTQAPHANFECEFCHRVRAGEASGDNAYSQITYTSTIDSRAKRYLVVTERDMEARNVPDVMTGEQISGFTYLSDVAMGKNSLSACTIPEAIAGGGVKGETAPAYTPTLCSAEILAGTFEVQEPRTFQATGLVGKDKNTTTAPGTFDASVVKYEAKTPDCSQSTRSPYGWTCGGLVANFNGSGSEVSNAGTKYHAASLVSCLECHGGEAPTGHHDAEYGVGALGGCNACHYAGGANKGGLANIMAGGFGLGVTTDDDGSLEVHKAFVTNNDGVLEYEAGASNTACVACHTHVAIDMAYNKPTTVKVDATLGRNGVETAINSVTADGSVMTYSTSP
jgi:hypothetical protein